MHFHCKTNWFVGRLFVGERQLSGVICLVAILCSFVSGPERSVPAIPIQPAKIGILAFVLHIFFPERHPGFPVCPIVGNGTAEHTIESNERNRMKGIEWRTKPFR